MFELVMALSVLALVFTFSLLVLSTSSRTELVNRRATAAQRLASEAAERAAVFDCGILPALPTALTAQQTRCEGSLGTRTWTVTELGAPFSLRLDAQWVVVHANTVLASTTTAASAPCPSYRLRRTVTASWAERGRTNSRTVSALAGLPVDSAARLRTGTIEVTGSAGSSTELLVSGFAYGVTLGNDGRALLPYLTPGTTYTLRNPNSLVTASVIVPAANGEACIVTTVSAP
jgi:hypothetical protein